MSMEMARARVLVSVGMNMVLRAPDLRLEPLPTLLLPSRTTRYTPFSLRWKAVGRSAIPATTIATVLGLLVTKIGSFVECLKGELVTDS